MASLTQPSLGLSCWWLASPFPEHLSPNLKGPLHTALCFLVYVSAFTTRWGASSRKKWHLIHRWSFMGAGAGHTGIFASNLPPS